MGEHRVVMATLRDATANPGPLGLMAFGMTTVLLNIHNAGFYELSSMILAMGIFYGGIAQVIAGIMEWKKNSTFGMTAFLSYGLFWLTLVGLIVFPKWTGVDGPDARRHGLVSVGLGRLHRAHVHRHAAHQPRAADRLPQPHGALRAARRGRLDGQRDDHQDRRLGGHLRRPRPPCTPPSPRCGTSSTAAWCCRWARQEVGRRQRRRAARGALRAAARGGRGRCGRARRRGRPLWRAFPSGRPYHAS